MSRTETILVGVGLALVIVGVCMLFRDEAKAAPPVQPPGRIVSELEIDANVYSPTWGMPIAPGVKAPLAEDSAMAELIARSNAVIQANP